MTYQKRLVLSRGYGGAIAARQCSSRRGSFAPDSTVMGPKAKAFLVDAENKWTSGKKDVWYSLGVNVRRNAQGYNVWHGGSWRYTVGSTNLSGAVSEHTGTYAVRSMARGTSWFAQYRPRPPDGASIELDGAIGRAIGQVKTWPNEDLYAGIGK